MRIRRSRSLLAAALAAMLVLPCATRAQEGASEAYIRGQDLEQRDQYAEAAAAYRQALAESPTSLPALLGLERVYAQLGRSDSLLPIVRRAIDAQPRVAALHAIELRALRSLGQPDQVRAAYERWRQAVPGDPQPYREYARMLIQEGATQAADSVLREGQAATHGGQAFDYELAQLRAALGLWEQSAASWRRAVADNEYLDQAATFSLVPTPVASRAAVRRALAQGPAEIGARKVLAGLELAWGAPRDGWDALRVLRPDSTVVAAWTEFAQRAEDAEAWLVARDALIAAHDAPLRAAAAEPVAVGAPRGASARADLAVRAASDALNGGDAAGAAKLAAGAAAELDSTAAAHSALPVQLRALSLLGRAPEAERVLAAYDRFVSPDERPRLVRLIAWGWIRSGNLDKARAMLAAAGGGDDEAAGWLALYEGDLATARQRLRASADAGPDALLAIAMLERSKADRSDAAGRAFLALARGDTAQAADGFEAAAHTLPEAAPLLLTAAARLDAAHGGAPKAIALWRSVVEQSPQAPEAPEAELELARALRKAGQGTEAVDRLEHLILTYPQSALVPQARRELEEARRAVPSHP